MTKGDHVEPKNDLHPHQQHHPPYHLHFHTPPKECQLFDQNGTAAATTAASITTSATPTTKPCDGATVDVMKRPRGRPPGSKNRPKPSLSPIIMSTREPEPSMSPYILEVPGGNDIVEALSRFCCRKKIGLCILSGSGTVANVTLRQPFPNLGATVTFHGFFDILSISATFLSPATSCPMPNGFMIHLAGPQGQVVGGLVAGALLAAGTVYLVATSFENPSFQRLPVEDEVQNSISGGRDGPSPPVAGGVESGISMYSSSHMPSDVIWAPSARQPPF